MHGILDSVEEMQTEDTVLDEYPVPDPSISPAALDELGCTQKDLLPMSADRACELLEDVTVYAVLPLGVLEMPFSGWDIRQYPPDTVFAVPKREWEKSMGFHMALNDRTGRQVQRERAFLRHAGDCYAVYQFNGAADAAMTLEASRTGGLSPRRAGYELVYAASLPENADIEELHSMLERNPPPGFLPCAVRNCDLIAVKKSGALKTWYIDRLAYSETPGLFENVPLSNGKRNFGTEKRRSPAKQKKAPER